MLSLCQQLKETSQQLNLFSTGDREKIASKHVPDALAVLPLWETEPGQLILDLGTGGGLPGLALATAHPELNFVLCDARAKKIAAVNEVASKLGLENVSAVSGRFEELARNPEHRDAYEIVVARAVAPLPILLEYAAGFVQEGGLFYAWKSQDHGEELKSAENAMEELYFELEATHNYELPEARSILVFRKTGPTEDEYPRADGVPKRSPL
jgi:16S rRNA (guanine527-N7)-methyltransferase